MHCWLRLKRHLWDGCVCVRCGRWRDKGHDMQVEWLQYSEEKSVLCVRCGALFDITNEHHIQDAKRAGFWVCLYSHTCKLRPGPVFTSYRHLEYYLRKGQDETLVKRETIHY